MKNVVAKTKSGLQKVNRHPATPWVKVVAVPAAALVVGAMLAAKSRNEEEETTN